MTPEEKKKYMKKYREDNKEKLKLSRDEWNARNKEKIANFNKTYRDKNKEVLNEKNRQYNLENKEKHKERNQGFNQENPDYVIQYRKENKEKIKETRKKYVIENREKINKKAYEYIKNRKNNDPLFKLSQSIRNNIRTKLKSNGNTKKSKTTEILGCSIIEFKKYLEKQFEPWMNWENYGTPKDGIFEPNKTWDIDHIVPTSSTIIEHELLALNHYSNLQPLCSHYNRFIKRNAI